MWMATKGDKISVKSFYDGMVKRGSKSFSTTRNWNSWAPTKVSFFVWEATWKGILIVNILKRRGGHWWTNVFYAKVKRNLAITSFFIVLRQVCYGNWSSPCLEWFGYYITQSKQRFLVGIAAPLEKGERRHGMLLLFVCFAPYGKRGIKGLLKMLSFQIKR